jgi:hypothetical protein
MQKEGTQIMPIDYELEVLKIVQIKFAVGTGKWCLFVVADDTVLGYFDTMEEADMRVTSLRSSIEAAMRAAVESVAVDMAQTFMRVGLEIDSRH